MPCFTQSSESEEVAAREGEAVRDFSCGCFLPLVEAIGRNEAAVSFECGAEGGLGGDGFCTGIDEGGGDLLVLCPRRQKPPSGDAKDSEGGNHGNTLRGGDVVAGFQGGKFLSAVIKGEAFAQPGEAGECVATAHESNMGE